MLVINNLFSEMIHVSLMWGEIVSVTLAIASFLFLLSRPILRPNIVCPPGRKPSMPGVQTPRDASHKTPSVGGWSSVGPSRGGENMEIWKY